MKEAGKQQAKQILKIQTKRNKKKISHRKLDFCSECFSKDSFYFRKTTHTIFQDCVESQKNEPGARLLVKETSMF